MHNLHNEFILPSPALRQVINHYEVFELKGAMTDGGVQLFPSLTVGLLFTFSAAKPIGVLSPCFEEEQLYDVVFVSPTTKVAYNYGFEDVSVLRVIFQPGMFAQAFGTPVRPFTNNLIDAAYSVDKELSSLRMQMGAQEGARAKIKVFEAYLLKKLAGKTLSSKLLLATTDALYHSTSDWAVKSVAAHFSLSQRQLNRKFSEAYGLSLKQFLQVYRFCSVLKFMHTPSFESLSDTAYRFGYADQAHFSHVFRTMMGQSPGAYLKQANIAAFPGEVDDLDHFGFLIDGRT